MAKGSKEKSSVSLPKAWKSVKHRNEMAQSRSNYEGLWQWIIGIILVLGLAYVLLGGINQRAAIEWVFDWAHNVQENFTEWVSGGGVVVNDDGIYIDPSGKSGNTFGSGQAGNTGSNQDEQSENQSNSEENNSNPETP